MKDNSIDTVIIFNVLEHVFDVKNAFVEINRCLKTNYGKIIGSTPFIHRVHGAPNDYNRYTKQFIEKILELTNYKNIEVENIGYGPFTSAYTMLFDYFKFIPFLNNIVLTFCLIFDGLISLFVKTKTNDIYPVTICFSGEKKIMCGINGFNFRNVDLIKRMSAITSSRGPDNEDWYISDNYTVGHNRLAIIDPEDRSNQPYKFKNLILSFNGEIYNYLDLKKDLISNGYKFETKSDTEVIIKLFDLEGVNSFKKLSGIFALSIYDTNKEKIYLIRDTVGVKPLYYYYDSHTKNFIYGSLINALLLSIKNKEFNYKALTSYSNFNRNDYRETFFKKVYKVLPGELIEVSNGDYKRSKFLNFQFKKNSDTSREINYYFSKQFISDVPVALSLSGGIDSSIIFHELLKNKGSKFTNYSVRFRNSQKYSHDHDIAEIISKNYGVKFESIEVNSNDFIDNAEKIIDIVEEPTGNTNSISNFILSRNISEKVLFSGDGGDEVFTGYNKYKSIYIASILKKLIFLVI